MNDERREVPRKKKKKRPDWSGSTDVNRDERIKPALADEVPLPAVPEPGEFDMPSLPDAGEIVQPREAVIADLFPYDVAYHFGFIGLGQGGSRLAQTAWEVGYRRVVVVDGAYQDLQDVPEEIPRLDLQTSGSAKDLGVGAASVADRDEDLWQLFQEGLGRDVDYLLACACLGGGTGSGAIHKVIEVAQRYLEHIGKPPRVGVLVSLPTGNEGQRVCMNALQTFNRLRQTRPAPMIIIDNQRIAELFPVGVTKLYAKCNEQIIKLLHLFNQLSAQRSRLVTFDRAEFADLLDSGIVTFGASPIRAFEKASDVAEAIRRQLATTALAKVDLKTATGAGCIFVGDTPTLDAVPMDVLRGGFDMCLRLLREDGVLHRGVYVGSAAGLRCFTMLAGLAPPVDRLRELGAEARIPHSRLAEFLGVDDAF